MKMEAAVSSESLEPTCYTTRRHIPAELKILTHYRQNLNLSTLLSDHIASRKTPYYNTDRKCRENLHIRRLTYLANCITSQPKMTCFNKNSREPLKSNYLPNCKASPPKYTILMLTAMRNLVYILYVAPVDYSWKLEFVRWKVSENTGSKALLWLVPHIALNWTSFYFQVVN